MATAPRRKLVIARRDVGKLGNEANSSSSLHFEVVFFEASSNILVNYADTIFGGACGFADNGGSATIGVQLASGRAAQYSFNTPSVSGNTALLWSLPLPP